MRPANRIALFPFLLLTSLLYSLEPRPKYTEQKGLKRISRPTNNVSRKVGFEDRLFGELNLVIGAKYKYGDEGIEGYDCSGLVRKVYRAVFGVELPRSARDIWKLGAPVAKSEIRPGDLVFFKTRSTNVDHIGIAVDETRFVHSSRKKGVMISSFDEDYYRKRFYGAKRIRSSKNPNLSTK